MHYSKYVFTLLVLTLTAACSSTSIPNESETYAETKVEAQSSQLRLILKPEKNSFTLGEPVKVKLYFKNDSDQDTWLAVPYVKGVNLLKRKNGGKVKKDRYLSNTSEYRKLTIAAGEELLYNQTSFDRSYFTSRGEWTLQIAERFGKAKGGWSGDISSNTITVTIE